MPRAAIYARYSSDNQKPTSIEDQVRLCRERAASLGASVEIVESDAEISGSSMVDRPGVRAIVAGAKAGRFDLVIFESLDRISRDLEDVAGIYKRLTYAGVTMHALDDGTITELHVGLKGTWNMVFLKDLANKIRRGNRGRAEAGKNTGGRAYGYRIPRTISAEGELVRGERVIDQDQAAIIRRIFAEYAAGISPRAIAVALNKEGVPSPRGGAWNASTIAGSRARRNGILHNDLYVGRQIYNRQAFRKDPDTGKRIPRVNDPKVWVTVDVPELRIVDDAVWAKVHAIKAESGSRPLNRRPRAQRLLSGLIRCGVCGGPFASHSVTRVGCTRRKEQGTCSNPRTMKSAELEERAIAGIRDQLLSPDIVAEYLREYREGEKRRRAEASGKRSRLEREIKDAEAKIRRMVGAIAEGTDTPAMREALVQLERRKGAAESELQAGEGADVVDLHPSLVDHYRRLLDALPAAVKADPITRAEVTRVFRSMIEAIVIHPEPGRGEVRVELHGQLAQILHAAGEQTRTRSVPIVRGELVAVDGFEPPTQGL